MKNRHLLTLLRTTFAGLFLLVLATVSFATQKDGIGITRPDDPDLMKRANQVTGIVSPDHVMKAQLQAEELRTKSASPLNLNWTQIGPANMSGSVWAAIYDSRDNTGSTIYAGAPYGGLFKSTNLGLTWNALPTATALIPRVSCMAQSKSGVFFVGTGQVYRGGYTPGNGLFTSTDGINFSVVPGTSFNPHWLGIAMLASDPRNERMYAATIGGLYYSDNGTDWTTAIAGLANDVCVGSDGTVIAVIDDSVYVAPQGDLANMTLVSTGQAGKLPNTGVFWARVAIAPSNPKVMYASLLKELGYMKGIYCSEDGGLTWQLVFPSSPSFEPYGIYGFVDNAIAVTPDNPGVLFIGSKKMWMGQKVSGQQYFDWEIVSDGSINPAEPSYAPNYHHSYSFQPGNSGRMLLSTDGGVTVATIRPGQIVYQTSAFNLQNYWMSTLSHTYKKNYVMGGAFHGGTIVLGAYYPYIVNEPNYGVQIWRDGNDYGDEGRSGGQCAWSKINPNVVLFTNADSNSSTYRTLRRRELSDLFYDNDPLGSDIVVKAGLNLPIYLAESFNYTYTRDSVKYINHTGIAIPAGTPITVNSKNGSFPFVYTTTALLPAEDSIMVPDPVQSRFFMSTTRSGRKGVFMNKYILQFDHAPEWFLVYKDISPNSNGDICTMTVSRDMNTLWMGTTAGRIYRASNLLLAYNYATADFDSPTFIVSNDTLTNLPFKGRYITGISVDPNNPNHVMVTLGNYGNSDYVYMTENGLDQNPTWKNVTGNLPGAPVLSGIIEMHSSNNALLGTDWGVFSTTNLTSANPEWLPDMANMGDVPVSALTQQTIQNYSMLNYGAIYAATMGKGCFQDTTYMTSVGIDPGPSHSGDLNNDLKISPNPVKDYASITYQMKNAGLAEILVYSMNGNLAMLGNLGVKSQGEATSRIDFSVLPSGMYIVRIGNSYGKIVKQ
jgi:hypothetical protein